MTEQLSLGPEPVPVKLRVEDYLLLDESGAFDGYAKTELIEGEVFCMNARHLRTLASNPVCTCVWRRR